MRMNLVVHSWVQYKAQHSYIDKNWHHKQYIDHRYCMDSGCMGRKSRSFDQ